MTTCVESIVNECRISNVFKTYDIQRHILIIFNDFQDKYHKNKCIYGLLCLNISRDSSRDDVNKFTYSMMVAIEQKKIAQDAHKHFKIGSSADF